ncbi:MAG TPA: hypothetical protein PLR83_04935 [Pyrinomonadaceae bacterium]|nr:hypothetical protein [Pyrinomonadaceae bacterium]
MNTATIRRNQRSTSRNRAKAGSHFRVYATMALAGAIVVSGFFLAATQHFSFWDFSIKNSRLRRQIDELQTEKRRLLVAREVSLSPGEIKKAAEKASLLTTADTAVVAQTISKPNSAASAAVQRKETAAANTASTVVRTTFVRPALEPNAPVQIAKRTNGESERRRIVSNAE